MFLSAIPEQVLALYLLLFDLDLLQQLLLLPLALEVPWVYIGLKDIHFIVYFAEGVLAGLLLLHGQIHFVSAWGFQFILSFALFALGTVENG